MKHMTRMLLINWHYIKYQVIDFAHINFLTGKNGAGKSTIIDALQLVLLGDTNGYYFNKAANDKSRRTIKGYLRGEVAEDEQTNTIYLRNDDFSSYIVLEFCDQNSQDRFCLGIVFDCYRDGSFEYRYFYLNSPLPENHFIQDEVPFNRDKLRAFFTNNYKKGKYEFFETNSRYRDVLLGKLGHLKKKFFSLFKKAVPFSPIMDIKGFISEFVCDVENKIDISDMKETIRYYKQLEQDLDLVKSKLNALDAINTLYDSYGAEKVRLEIQSYIVDRGEEEKLQEQIISLLQEIKKLQEEISSVENLLVIKEEELKLLNKQKDSLLEEKVSSDVYKKREELHKEIATLNLQIEKISNTKKELKDFFYSFCTQWTNINEWLQENFSEVPSLQKQLIYFQEIYSGRFEILRENELLTSVKDMRTLANTINETYAVKKTELDSLKDSIKVLRKQINNLEKGIKPFPFALLELKKLIQDNLKQKYGKEIEAFIFADLIEIKNDKWRNAIEAYLHTQKFYLLIEPRYFQEALEIYDSFKFSKKIYDIGLVDIEKIIVQKPSAQKNSLAEEIETENELAQAYVNYLLGRVNKCETVQQLRQYKTAITPSCMLYHKFVARQLNPKRYETPYIGRNAIVQQLERKKELLVQNETFSQKLQIKVARLEAFRDVSIINEENIKNILEQRDSIILLPQLEEDVKNKTMELGKLDLSYLTELDKALQKTEEDINFIGKQKEDLLTNKGKLSTKVQNKKDEVPLLKNTIQTKQDIISERYTREWIDETGEGRFQKELESKKDLKKIIEGFAIAVKRTASIMEGKLKELWNKRIAYNKDFNGSFDVQAKDNNAYKQESTMLTETLLVDYEAKIKDAQEKAQIQFKEDFISKLKSNIEAAKEQIDDLNKALRDIPFGRDKYRFKIIPNAQYKKYYDMITDELLLEGLTLFSNTFQEKYQDVVEELFRQIIDTEEGLLTADRQEELNKNLEKYTDYRTYLDFDLIVTDDSGNESRLSRVITKKSGGETQTPFYISVLASFVQLYRVNQSENNTARMIVFDEAYSKMDHQRIKESINLIRNMGLQVILSAPTEKIGDIAPQVDRNLCVTRIKNETIVRAFDPKDIEKMGA